MDALVWFLFGPFHVALKRRKWENGPEVRISNGKHTFNVMVRRPRTEFTHPVDDSHQSQRVAHVNIPVRVRCELSGSDESYEEIAKVVVDYLGPLVEELRASTQQCNLHLKEIADLEVLKVETPDGQDLPDIKRKYQRWIESQDHDSPPADLTLSDWQTLLSAQPSGGKVLQLSDWGRRVPLDESLLLDAELELASDVRVGVLYAALACEIFIQGWLERQSISNQTLKRWLDWAGHRTGPENSVSVKTYYDLGVYFAAGKSLREEKSLWEAFGKLIGARNKVAHYGQLPERYSSADAIVTARRVTEWVARLNSPE